MYLADGPTSLGWAGFYFGHRVLCICIVLCHIYQQQRYDNSPCSPWVWCRPSSCLAVPAQGRDPLRQPRQANGESRPHAPQSTCVCVWGMGGGGVGWFMAVLISQIEATAGIKAHKHTHAHTHTHRSTRTHTQTHTVHGTRHRHEQTAVSPGMERLSLLP